MNENELCKALEINRSTAYMWRLRGMPFVLLESGKYRYSYDIEEVQAWLAAHGRKRK